MLDMPLLCIFEALLAKFSAESLGLRKGMCDNSYLSTCVNSRVLCQVAFPVIVSIAFVVIWQCLAALIGSEYTGS